MATTLASRPHPQQGLCSCLSIIRLGKTYGEERLEAACHCALALEACAYKSLESILRHGLDQQPLTPERVSPPVLLTSIAYSACSPGLDRRQASAAHAYVPNESAVFPVRTGAWWLQQ